MSQAADTVASLGDSIKATQFVTAVDHTMLSNGTTRVVANTNGTASIVSRGIEEKPNCVRVSIADGSTGKTIVLSFKHTPEELEQFQEYWPSQVEFTITYDGVIYDAVTVGETDDEWGREVSSSLSWADGGSLYPSGYGTFTPGSYWNGVFACSGTPGGVQIIGDGHGEICSTYTYASETSVSKTIATTDQLYDCISSATNGLATTTWVNAHQWTWASITNKPSFAAVATSGSYNDLNNKPTIPINVSAFNNDANYTSASTATNIARQIIRDAVSQVNVNLQSAEDTRAALTNLITILKNL